jgi:hypothetical protein
VLDVNATEAKRTYRLQERLKQVQSRRASGLCVKAWCEQNGVSENRYYYWLRDICKAALQAGNSNSQAEEHAIVKVDFPAAEPSPGDLTGRPTIRLQYKGGIPDVPPGADACDIAAVLKALNES